MRYKDYEKTFVSTAQRLQHCFEHAAYEYYQRWEGLVTLRTTGRANEENADGRLLKDGLKWVTAINHAIKIADAQDEIWYSTYCHRGSKGYEDYHLHIYVRRKGKRSIKDVLNTLEKTWAMVIETNNRFVPGTTISYFDYKHFTDKTPAFGQYGYYGIKSAYNEVWVDDLWAMENKDWAHGAKEGAKWMKERGFSSDWWDYLNDKYKGRDILDK